VSAVLDAWAMLAVLQGEPAAERVRTLMAEDDTVASAVNVGEVLYRVTRESGERRALELVERVRGVVEVEDPDWPLIRAAARVKARGGVSYADAFAVATAHRHRAPLYTGDPEIVSLTGEVDVVDLREGS